MAAEDRPALAKRQVYPPRRMPIPANLSAANPVIFVHPDATEKAVAITPRGHERVKMRTNHIHHRRPCDLVTNCNVEILSHLLFAVLIRVLGECHRSQWTKAVAPFSHLRRNTLKVALQLDLETGEFNFVNPDISRS